MAQGIDTFSAGFSANPDFDYELRTVLGLAFAGASDPGEVLAAVQGIRRKDHRGWFAAWDALGDRVSAVAASSAEAGHPVSASQASLRSSAYYGVAVNAISALGDEGLLLPTFRKQRQAWDAFVDASELSIDRVSIPYEDGSLPGYLFHPAADRDPRPTLVVTNGSDGSLASLWASAISGALKRGYTVLVYDGPGQQSMLFERNVPFRPDWEAVLTPVLDFALGQPSVDPARVAVYGISQAGYWVPRALAFEHRFAAAIVDPGVVDVSTSWTSHFPKALLKTLAAGDVAKFDREMAEGMRFTPGTARTWAFRARPYGGAGPGAGSGSGACPRLGYGETLLAVQQYALGEHAAAITTPLLITSPEKEQFWPGQSEQLAAATPSVSTLVPFTAAEGADYHCQPLARGLTEQRIFDWLDETLA